MRLDWDTVPSAMDFNLQSQIMAVAPRKISQMLVEVTVLTNIRPVGYWLKIKSKFLLVSLNIYVVLE